MKGFEAFKKTLSQESLSAIYEATKLEVSDDYLEGTEAYAIALASQMATNLLDKYQEWVKEQ